jgi:redox-sensitive bicupin YhaK (pirin superfamily)
MIRIRKADERGRTRLGWLESYHTFSFGTYYDPQHPGFRTLRVINEDRVQPGQGFGTHSHRDMEIISYVLDGALEHRDSLDNGSVIRPGDVQLMRAGTGVMHSEYNPSSEDFVHFLQIWILPDEQGLAPAYEQRHFPLDERRNVLRRVASRNGRDDSLRLHQDAELYATILEHGHSVSHELAEGRHAWVQVARGRVRLNGLSLQEGDGAALSDEPRAEIVADGAAELLVFDLG